jgi:phosphoribosylglycinamide formyltransferase-1
MPERNSSANTTIAIFASGAGSNAQKIIDHFRGHPTIKIGLIVCNKEGAGVLSIAKKEHIETLMINKERFFRGDAFVPELEAHFIDFVVLAGFLWKIPVKLIQAYPNKIINIHPALLPKYGGKGMYGNFVHEAVVAANETESGITIHYVDELYDHGGVIFRASCLLDKSDTAESLAKKIHALEHLHYPGVIEEVIKLRNRS